MSTRFDVMLAPLGAAQLGGAERSVTELAIELTKNGLRVLVVAEPPLRSTPFRENLERDGVTVHEARWSADGPHWKNAWEAVKFFRRYRAPIVHFNVCWRPRLWLIPIIAKMVAGASLIGTMRVMPDSHHQAARKRYFGFIPGMRLWMIKPKLNGWVWARTVQRIVSINQYDFPSRMVDDYFFAPENVRLIYNGIPMREGIDRSRLKARYRAEMEMAEHEFLLVYAGRLSKEKGVDDLLKAMGAVPPHVRLAVVGEGPMEQELKALTLELGLQDRVRFFGFQPNPRDWIAGADAVVVPSSEGEAFGRVVIEAMAEGAPLIASDAGGMGELFEHDVHGLYFPARDVATLASRIAAVVQDPALAQRLAEAAAVLVRERYAVQRVCRQYMELYDELVTVS